MKQKIHPEYKEGVEVDCICGNKFNINSTVEGPIKVESCPECHPTYTGKQETKVMKGRMEKFYERQKRVNQAKNSENNK